MRFLRCNLKGIELRAHVILNEHQKKIERNHKENEFKTFNIKSQRKIQSAAC